MERYLANKWQNQIWTCAGSFSGKETPRLRFAGRTCIKTCSQDQHLSEASKNGQREKLGCDSVATEASAKPSESFEAGVAPWSCPKPRPVGWSLCPPMTTHWMQLHLGKVGRGLRKAALFSPGNSWRTVNQAMSTANDSAPGSPASATVTLCPTCFK